MVLVVSFHIIAGVLPPLSKEKRLFQSITTFMKSQSWKRARVVLRKNSVIFRMGVIECGEISQHAWHVRFGIQQELWALAPTRGSALWLEAVGTLVACQMCSASWVGCRCEKGKCSSRIHQERSFHLRRSFTVALPWCLRGVELNGLNEELLPWAVIVRALQFAYLSKREMWRSRAVYKNTSVRVNIRENCWNKPKWVWKLKGNFQWPGWGFRADF